MNNRLDWHSVTVLDAATLRPCCARYKVPGGPDDIAFAPDGKLWLTLRFANKVAVLDPASGAVETSTSAARRTASSSIRRAAPPASVAAR